MSSLRGDDARTTVLQVDGEGSLAALAPFGGTHRVQRVPSNGGGRKHTSTATVAVLDDVPADEVRVRDEDLRVERMRGHGRGGQRRNKVETAVRVTHVPSGLVVTRLSGRSQAANLDDARREIASRLAEREAASREGARTAARRPQVDPERSGKGFTHCWYRDEVLRHADGRRWTVRDWRQGRL